MRNLLGAIRVWAALAGWLVGGAMTLWGQGTLVGSNAAGPRTHFVTDAQGVPLGGTNWLVELTVKNPASGKFEGGLQKSAGTDQWQTLGVETLRDGKLAGVFSFGMLRVPFVPPGQEAQVRLRVWDGGTAGATFDQSRTRGETNLTLRLGGLGNPPTFPARLTAFRGLKVTPAKP
jgi:hypothetical protein